MAQVSLVPSAWAPGFGSNDLSSLANGTTDSSSLTLPHIDNSSGAALWVQFEISLGALSPTAGACVVVALIPETTTGGVYATGADTATANDQYRWQNGPHAVIALRLTASTAQVQRSGRIPIEADRYKIVVLNRAGVAFPASGNQVFWRTITEKVI